MVDRNAIEDFMTGADEAAPAPASAVQEVDVEAKVEFDDALCRFLPLRHPITVDGERVSRIRMRPPLLEDVDDWSNAEISNRELMARLCERPSGVLKKLVWSDAEALMEIFHQMVPEFVFAAPKDDA
ncbi:hypothetical protein CK224_09660 [Mesorhizobium sp. WSM3862]|nr:hypothetical protein CK224_09660 [Mesorhizobium sp. WSM3862]